MMLLNGRTAAIYKGMNSIDIKTMNSKSTYPSFYEQITIDRANKITMDIVRFILLSKTK